MERCWPSGSGPAYGFPATVTSLVGGPLGRFPVDSGGNVILDNGRLSALAPDPASPTEPAQSPVKRQWRVNSRALGLAVQRPTE